MSAAPAARSCRSRSKKLLAPVLLGRDSFGVEALWTRMYQEALLQGRAGVVMRAISVLDTALWDLNARTAGVPLHKYLGASAATRVPAYASGGYYLEGKTPERLGEEMAGYVARRLQRGEDEDRPPVAEEEERGSRRRARRSAPTSR